MLNITRVLCPTVVKEIIKNLTGVSYVQCGGGHAVLFAM